MSITRIITIYKLYELLISPQQFFHQFDTSWDNEDFHTDLNNTDKICSTYLVICNGFLGSIPGFTYETDM